MKRWLILLLAVGGCSPPRPAPTPVATWSPTTGRIVQTLDVATGQPRWTFHLPGLEQAYRSSNTLGERVFVHSGEALYGLNAKNGHELWRTHLKPAAERIVAFENRLFGLRRNYVTAIEAETGKILWEVRLVADHIVCAGPVLGVGDSLKATFSGLDTATGKLLWTVPAVEGGKAAASARHFFLAATGEAWAVTAADGKEVWRHKGLDPQTSTAEAYHDGVVAVRTWEGLVGLAESDGSQRWLCPDWGSDVQAQDGAFVFSGNPAGTNLGPVRLLCLQARDGKTKWTVAGSSASASSVFLAGQRVAFITADNDGQHETGTAVVNLTDGKELWRIHSLCEGATPFTVLLR